MAGTLHTHVQQMAHYNMWATERLLADIVHVSEEYYRGDSGLPFRSIHGTLTHILLAEWVWYKRLVGVDATEDVPSLSMEPTLYWSQPTSVWEEAIPSRQVLGDQLVHSCQRWIEYVSKLSEEDLSGTFTFINSQGKSLTMMRWPILDHIFNHGTHHRGQVTAALARNSYYWEPLDLVFFLQKDG